MCLFLGIMTIISTIIWYAFFYYLLYSIKKDVNLYQAALCLLLLISAGLATCPVILYRTLIPMYEELQVECWKHLS